MLLLLSLTWGVLCGPLIVHFVMLYTGKHTDRVIKS